MSSVTRLRQDVAFVRAALYGGQPIASLHRSEQLSPTHSLWISTVPRRCRRVRSRGANGSSQQNRLGVARQLPTLRHSQFRSRRISPARTASDSLSNPRGFMDTATVSFQAIDNHPPSVDFASRRKSSSRYNPYRRKRHPDVDGDSLAIHWTVDGGSYVPLTGLSYADSAMGKWDSAGVTSTFFPFRISRFTVKASVSDPHYSVEFDKRSCRSAACYHKPAASQQIRDRRCSWPPIQQILPHRPN